MAKVTLKHPIKLNGAEVSTLSLRRPKARDMIVLGDHLPALASVGEDDASAIRSMNSKTFEAMVAIVGRLSDIGDAALDLDFEDLVAASTEAFSFMGEPDPAGTAKTGAAA